MHIDELFKEEYLVKYNDIKMVYKLNKWIIKVDLLLMQGNAWPKDDKIR